MSEQIVGIPQRLRDQIEHTEMFKEYAAPAKALAEALPFEPKVNEILVTMVLISQGIDRALGGAAERLGPVGAEMIPQMFPEMTRYYDTCVRGFGLVFATAGEVLMGEELGEETKKNWDEIVSGESFLFKVVGNMVTGELPQVEEVDEGGGTEESGDDEPASSSVQAPGAGEDEG